MIYPTKKSIKAIISTIRMMIMTTKFIDLKSWFGRKSSRMTVKVR